MDGWGGEHPPTEGFPPHPRQQPAGRPPRPPGEHVESILNTRRARNRMKKKQLSTEITSCSPTPSLTWCVDEGGLRLRREGDSRESVSVLLVLPRPRGRRQEDRALHGARLRLRGPPPDPPRDRGIRGPRERGAGGTHGGVGRRPRAAGNGCIAEWR